MASITLRYPRRLVRPSLPRQQQDNSVQQTCECRDRTLRMITATGIGNRSLQTTYNNIISDTTNPEAPEPQNNVTRPEWRGLWSYERAPRPSQRPPLSSSGDAVATHYLVMHCAPGHLFRCLLAIFLRLVCIGDEDSCRCYCCRCLHCWAALTTALRLQRQKL